MSRWSIDPGDPRRLAMVRIGLFGYIAIAVGTPWLGPESLWQLRRWAAVPQDVMLPPPRYQWIPEATWEVFPPLAVTTVAILMLGCALAATAGWRTRITGTVVTVAGIYVWLLPQLFGKVNHYHHLVLLALVIAWAPSAEVWSLRREKPAPRSHHQVANYGIWTVLGLVYLFPGVAKLATAGWASADAMERIILAQRAIGQVGDAVPLDLLPLALLGPATLVFEIGFLPAVLLSRWTRLAWAVMGVAFHIGIMMLLGIRFLTLAPVYLALVPLREREETLSASLDDGGGTLRASLPVASTVAVAVVVAGLFVSGLSARQSDWPFAAYPFVNSIPGNTVAVPVIHVDGEPVAPNAIHPWMSWQRAQFFLIRSVAIDHERGVMFMTGVGPDRVDIVLEKRELAAFR